MRRAGEDYLEAILQLEASSGGNGVRVTDLALKLDVSKPSVNRGMKLLRDEGYIEQEAYGNVYLSESGRRLAEDVYLRHQTLMSFFSEVLEVEPEIAEQDACRVEHDISREALDKLIGFMAGGVKPLIKGPALGDIVEKKVRAYLEEKMQKGEIRAYETRFDDRFSPVAFRYRRGDGRTVACMLKYEGFDRKHIEIKNKILNYLLERPDEDLELWYVRRGSEGLDHKIEVSRSAGKVLRRLITSVSESSKALSSEGFSLGCCKLSADTELFDFEELLSLGDK